MLSLRGFFKLEPAGYLDLGKRVCHKVIEGHCPAHAAAIAYYFLFAVFPFILFLITVIGHLPVPHLLEFVLRRASKMLPGQLFDLLQDSIRASSARKDADCSPWDFCSLFGARPMPLSVSWMP